MLLWLKTCMVFLTMSIQYRAQMVNSAHMANNQLGINVDDNRFGVLAKIENLNNRKANICGTSKKSVFILSA